MCIFTMSKIHKVIAFQVFSSCCVTLVLSSIPTTSPDRCEKTGLNQTKCGSSLMCVNGICNANDSGGRRCHCKNGSDWSWVGASCNKCCNLTCVHGECQYIEDDDRYTCECEDNTWMGRLCHVKRCTKKCENGNCKIGDNDQQICACNAFYGGDICATLAAGPFVGLVVPFVVLVTLIMIMPYIMWRRRAVIILRIHYFFQKYEDNDVCEYDAFISYGKADEDAEFVGGTLVPLLENEMDFTTCYKDRDFVFGEAHIDNIIAAVQHSRRTILVITPDYLEDEWPVFEALQAQMQSLSTAHKVIPLILVPAPIDHPTLRNIVSSLRIIKWPAECTERKMKKLKQRLAYSMPKLRRQGLSDSVTSSIIPLDIRNGSVSITDRI